MMGQRRALLRDTPYKRERRAQPERIEHAHTRLCLLDATKWLSGRRISLESGQSRYHIISINRPVIICKGSQAHTVQEHQVQAAAACTAGATSAAIPLGCLAKGSSFPFCFFPPCRPNRVYLSFTSFASSVLGSTGHSPSVSPQPGLKGSDTAFVRIRQHRHTTAKKKTISKDEVK